MFTGTPKELRKLQDQARKLALQTADLLNQLDALGLGSGSGQLHTPGGIIRNRLGQGWIVTDR
ncbi:hypothetical protein [Streptomyces yunnanensis]|uniref:Uncharacterized protein n=1 Tax=Streptomyces yunnanensis TaxID=156453 RepID=A0A9X8MT93_9ACTN|nr:hypothetical protein [Streptomyces yunnanensis]SHL75030.1 hypothetical protein SAMN05216268_10669 [Streptomyces yunnanensis]